MPTQLWIHIGLNMSARLRCVLALLACLPVWQTARADDWPQWLGPKRDGVWRETGILETLPKDGPKIRWRVAIGAGYSGPAVADGRVVVTDRLLNEGTDNPKNPFAKGKLSGKDRILCLEAATGKMLWKHEYESTYEVAYPLGPRTTPVIADGKVYALGTMGELFRLDAKTGAVDWSKNFLKEYETGVPLWGFAASPLLDGDKLICLVGGKGSVVVALNKDTGKEIWRALSAKEPGYCPPMIYTVGTQRQLIIWHPESVNGIDPRTGKLLWSQKFLVRAALCIPTPRFEGDRLFISSFYNGSMLLKLAPNQPSPEVLWRGKGRSEKPKETEGLHCIMSTPVMKDGSIYGVCSYGELRCLKEETGERVWETLQATGGASERWANAFIIAQGDRYFLFNEKGDLIIAKMSPKGYEELSRAHILEPTDRMPGRLVNWSHPAFALQAMFARNDKEIVCVSLAANEK